MRPAASAAAPGARAAGIVVVLAVLGALLAPLPARAAATVGAGTWENTSSALALKGTWKKVKGSQDSGGSVGVLSTSGYARLSFTTPGVRWVARTSSSLGLADVYVDGVKKARVDLYSAATRSQQTVFELTGLPAGTHTLSVQRAGTKNARSSGTNITLDAFVTLGDQQPPAAPTGLTATTSGDDVALRWGASTENDVTGYRVYRSEGAGGTRVLVAAPAVGTTLASDPARQPGATYVYDVRAVDSSGNESASSASASVTLPIALQGAGTYEDGSAAVGLRGPWTTLTSAADSGGSVASLGAAGYAQLSFDTSGVRWVARRDAAAGIADVYLDGAKRASVDLYASSAKAQQRVYEIKGLPEGPHTLRIAWSGRKNAASRGTAVNVDVLVTPDVRAPAAPTGLRATAEAGAVSLAWAANAEPDLKGYRVYRSDDDGGARAQVGSTTAGTTRLVDTGRTPGTAYVYDVVAVDLAGNASTPSATSTALVPAPGQGEGTYQDGSAPVLLRGAWTTTRSAGASGGSYASLKGAGSAQLWFGAPGVRWVARLDRSGGVADVYLDGVRKASVDLYAATPVEQQVVYEVADLPAGPHQLKVVWTGSRNPAATGSVVHLDAFVVPDVTPPSPPTGLRGFASGRDVGLGWTASPEADVASYEVFRRDPAGGPRTSIGTVPTGTTTYTDPRRIPGDTYSYDVVAVDTAGNRSAPSAGTAVTVAVVAEGAGTYENDNPTVTLEGAWNPISSRMESGGSYAALNAPGYAQVSFRTSGVRWVSRTNNYSGTADVYLDGAKVARVDLYSPTTKFQQVVYEVKGLPETTHTLRVVRTGERNDASRSATIMLDAFVAPDIYPPSAPDGLVATGGTASMALRWNPSPEADVVGYRVYRGGPSGALKAVTTELVDATAYVDDTLQPGATYRYQVTAVDVEGNESLRSGATTGTVAHSALPAGTYEDDHPDVVKVGPWSRTASSIPKTDSGGSFSSLNGDGYAEMSFGTSGIRWLARTNNYSGMADVYVDGVKRARVDLYSATSRQAQTVYEVSGLSETEHTIRIVRTGTKNPASAGRGITLDALLAPDLHAPTPPAAPVAEVTRTGARVSWAKSPERDVAGYRVLRRAQGSTTDVLVGTTDARTTSFTDAGLASSTSFSWTVVAFDSSDNVSAPSSPADLTTAADPYAAYPFRAASCPAATVSVSNRSQLLSAIAGATSGTVIRLAPGSYGANYLISTKASADRPVWICGPRTAVFDAGDTTKGNGIRFNGSQNVVLAGVTVRNVQKGVTVQWSRGITIADLRVERIGDEAVHLKNQTKDSTVIGNSIDTTGLNAKNYGEGVYIGTAQANWCLYNDCQPDSSDRNVIAFNDIRGNTAESIEAKAGTNDGTMWRNTMDGSSITADDADSFIQVMGSGWVIAGNVGTRVGGDAIQVWNTDDGSYGLDNVVYDNAVTDALPGYVVRFPAADAGNVVGCDNRALGTALGTSNKTCQN